MLAGTRFIDAGQSHLVSVNGCISTTKMTTAFELIEFASELNHVRLHTKDIAYQTAICHSARWVLEKWQRVIFLREALKTGTGS